MKSSYDEFKLWWKKISGEHRNTWVYYKNNKELGALLIMKDEDEELKLEDIILSQKRRIKVSTLIVKHTGFKIGELFIKLAVDYALKMKIDEIYLTHFIESNDYLVDLIEEYGFVNVGNNNRNEAIFIKDLNVKKIPEDLLPHEIAKIYYPSFYDGVKVSKFIVPIQPDYHDLLFNDYLGRQTRLDEFNRKMLISGNTIKKAYLCHALIKMIKKGDILLFYRSTDQKLTSLCVVDNVFQNQTQLDEILRNVGKRSVFSSSQIKKMLKKPILAISFIHIEHFKNPLNFVNLKELGILNGPPQSIRYISEAKYLTLKKHTIINGSLNVN